MRDECVTRDKIAALDSGSRQLKSVPGFWPSTSESKDGATAMTSREELVETGVLKILQRQRIDLVGFFSVAREGAHSSNLLLGLDWQAYPSSCKCFPHHANNCMMTIAIVSLWHRS